MALVLISTAGLALFSWMNINLDAASRLRARDAARAHQAAALALAQTLNPLRRASGEAELGDGLRMRWTAQPLSPLTNVAPLPGGTLTSFRVQMFEMRIELLGPEPAPRGNFTLVRMGTQRDAPDGLPGAGRAP